VNWLAAVGLGFALGVVTGMPLGVVNVAIADAAARGHVAFAVRIGIGGAIADSVHAAIAFLGVGAIVTSHPEWTRAMAVVALVVIVVFAALSLRARTRSASNGREGGDGRGETAGTGARGIVAGIALTLPNPGALAAWVAVAASVWPAIDIGPAIALALAVGAGSALWFAAFARWVAASPHRAVVAKVGLVLLVAIGVAGAVRALA